MSYVRVYMCMCVCVSPCALAFLNRVHFQSHKLDDRTDSFSVETLLDALCVLYDECCSSSFKREKTVADFIETGGLGGVASPSVISTSSIKSWFLT